MLVGIALDFSLEHMGEVVFVGKLQQGITVLIGFGVLI
jgi:hypothetical protein